jgi:hypothetical protein
MDPAGALLTSLVFAGVMLYVLYFVIRAAVEAGIRRALPDSRLRPRAGEPQHLDETSRIT